MPLDVKRYTPGGRPTANIGNTLLSVDVVDTSAGTRRSADLLAKGLGDLATYGNNHLERRDRAELERQAKADALASLAARRKMNAVSAEARNRITSATSDKDRLDIVAQLSQELEAFQGQMTLGEIGDDVKREETALALQDDMNRLWQVLSVTENDSYANLTQEEADANIAAVINDPTKTWQEKAKEIGDTHANNIYLDDAEAQQTANEDIGRAAETEIRYALANGNIGEARQILKQANTYLIDRHETLKNLIDAEDIVMDIEDASVAADPEIQQERLFGVFLDPNFSPEVKELVQNKLIAMSPANDPDYAKRLGELEASIRLGREQAKADGIAYTPDLDIVVAQGWSAKQAQLIVARLQGGELPQSVLTEEQQKVIDEFQTNHYRQTGNLHPNYPSPSLTTLNSLGTSVEYEGRPEAMARVAEMTDEQALALPEAEVQKLIAGLNDQGRDDFYAKRRRANDTILKNQQDSTMDVYKDITYIAERVLGHDPKNAVEDYASNPELVNAYAEAIRQHPSYAKNGSLTDQERGQLLAGLKVSLRRGDQERGIFGQSRGDDVGDAYQNDLSNPDLRVAEISNNMKLLAVKYATSPERVEAAFVAINAQYGRRPKLGEVEAYLRTGNLPTTPAPVASQSTDTPEGVPAWRGSESLGDFKARMTSILAGRGVAITPEVEADIEQRYFTDPRASQ